MEDNIKSVWSKFGVECGKLKENGVYLAEKPTEGAHYELVGGLK